MFLLLCFGFFYSKVGLNVLVQRANKFTPATRLLIQRFVPFPAVGKKERLFSILQVLAVNLPVEQSHWDGHLAPAFLAEAVAAVSARRRVPESVQAVMGWCRATFPQQNDPKLLVEAACKAVSSCAFHSRAV